MFILYYHTCPPPQDIYVLIEKFCSMVLQLVTIHLLPAHTKSTDHFGLCFYNTQHKYTIPVTPDP